jgi:hypothetical protein
MGTGLAMFRAGRFEAFGAQRMSFGHVVTWVRAVDVIDKIARRVSFTRILPETMRGGSGTHSRPRMEMDLV